MISCCVLLATGPHDDGLPKRRRATVGMTVEWEKYCGLSYREGG